MQHAAGHCEFVCASCGKGGLVYHVAGEHRCADCRGKPRLKLDGDGRLDEIAWHNARSVVLERLDVGGWQLRVTGADGRTTHVEILAAAGACVALRQSAMAGTSSE